MQALGLPLRLHVADKEEAVEQSKTTESGKLSLGMAYLTKGGIIWVPEYTLKLIDEENAELTLRGTIINEAEDLVHADIHLVVGVPHFAHSDQLAPIAVGQAIRTIGTALGNNVSLSNGIPPQALGYYRKPDKPWKKNTGTEVVNGKGISFMEPDDLNAEPFYRRQVHTGYLGQGYTHEIRIPPKQAIQNESATPNLPDDGDVPIVVAREQILPDGTMLRESAKAIHSVKHANLRSFKRIRRHKHTHNASISGHWMPERLSWMPIMGTGR